MSDRFILLTKSSQWREQDPKFVWLFPTKNPQQKRKILEINESQIHPEMKIDTQVHDTQFKDTTTKERFLWIFCVFKIYNRFAFYSINVSVLKT
jgi:hypothetical protein